MGSSVYELKPHPDTPPRAVTRVTATIIRDAGGISLNYHVAPGAVLALPEEAEPARAHGLWKTTCFELFARNAAGEYLEFNLSPSLRWAAYRFSGYREAMAAWPCDAPEIRVMRAADNCALEADLRDVPPQFDRIGLSAVIEETDGTKSYWALAHPPEGPPDFHHPACFALHLPAPTGA